MHQILEYFFTKILINAIYFSTWTPYKNSENLDESPIFPENYDITYVRYIGRHGSRYPSKKNMVEIKFLSEKFADIPLEYQHYVNFSKNLIDFKNDKILSLVGQKELYDLGHRYKRRLQNLFNQPDFSIDQLNFESTCASRSSDSMGAFIKGMMGDESIITNMPQGTIIPCDVDMLYRFFDFCKRYNDLHKCLQEYEKEQSLFLNTPLMNNIAAKILKKLGLAENNNFTTTDVRNLYATCAFEILVNNATINDGPCKLFDIESLGAFDYYCDIKHFYKKSNSHKINIQVSCPLFKKIYSSVESAIYSCNKSISGSKTKLDIKGDFGFAHAETLLPILGFLRLFKDSSPYYRINKNERINTENYPHLKYNRTFNGGYYSPMAGNVAFVVGCPKQPSKQDFFL
ncbi:hypothetical protein HZS_4854 [Henneguya salminicola]|nr:hypothetical protein HZS_4854 [Henneguya salminicola]